MNGIGLLVLISLFGQIGQLPVLETEKDFGWQINPEDGVLEYIIQLSPDTITLMQLHHQEKPSEIPNELVGRVTRTVVRIGTEPLPRTPSLAEIGKMPRFGSVSDMQAQLDPGRFSDVESIKNVQQNDFPALPGGFGSAAAGSLSDSAQNLIDRVGNAAAGNAPRLPDMANSFLENAGNGSSAPAPLNTAQGNSPNAAAPKRFQDTAPPLSGYPSTSPASPSPSTAGPLAALPQSNAALGRDFNWDTPNARTADTRGPAAYPAPRIASPNDPISLQANGNPNTYLNNTPGLGFGVAPNGQMLGSNLNDTIRQNQQLNQRNQENDALRANYEQWYYQQYGTYPPQNEATFVGTGGSSLPNADVTHVASTNNTMPNRAGGSQSNATTPSASDAAGEGRTDASVSTATAGAPDNILLVFFLLSLIVNCYLGGLIRKLLTRYRALLSNVRNQSFDAA